MKAKITFLETGKIQTLEISEVLYTSEKIILFQTNGSFTSIFHGDKATIQITVNKE